MKTRQRFRIIYGISSVKCYLADCAKCALKKAKPIRRLMADLPSFRVTTVNKQFKLCGTDYFGPILYNKTEASAKLGSFYLLACALIVCTWRLSRNWTLTILYWPFLVSLRAGIDEQVFSAILLLQQLSFHLHVKLFFCKFTRSNEKFWRRKQSSARN